MAESVLRLEDVTMQFGGVIAVNNLSMEINRGEIVALIGPNGAGKTTAFNCITGVYEPTNGIVYFHGKPIVVNHPQGKMIKQYGGINGESSTPGRTAASTPVPWPTPPTTSPSWASPAPSRTSACSNP